MHLNNLNAPVLNVLIDVAIPTDRNVEQKEAEKKLKYYSFCLETQRMWNLKYTIIPVIIGATGMLTKSLRKNVESVPGKHSIDSLQKKAVEVWNLKPEWWGSPLVQETYQEEKAYDKRYPYPIIINIYYVLAQEPQTHL